VCIARVHSFKDLSGGWILFFSTATDSISFVKERVGEHLVGSK
jgi:hypothetical protein